MGGAGRPHGSAETLNPGASPSAIRPFGRGSLRVWAPQQSVTACMGVAGLPPSSQSLNEEKPRGFAIRQPSLPQSCTACMGPSAECHCVFGPLSRVLRRMWGGRGSRQPVSGSAGEFRLFLSVRAGATIVGESGWGTRVLARESAWPTGARGRAAAWSCLSSPISWTARPAAPRRWAPGAALRSGGRNPRRESVSSVSSAASTPRDYCGASCYCCARDCGCPAAAAVPAAAPAALCAQGSRAAAAHAGGHPGHIDAASRLRTLERCLRVDGRRRLVGAPSTRAARLPSTPMAWSNAYRGAPVRWCHPAPVRWAGRTWRWFGEVGEGGGGGLGSVAAGLVKVVAAYSVKAVVEAASVKVAVAVGGLVKGRRSWRRRGWRPWRRRGHVALLGRRWRQPRQGRGLR